MISILLVFAVCGPGQKKSAAEEKATEDSIAKAAQYPMAFETFLKPLLNPSKGFFFCPVRANIKVDIVFLLGFKSREGRNIKLNP